MGYICIMGQARVGKYWKIEGERQNGLARGYSLEEK